MFAHLDPKSEKLNGDSAEGAALLSTQTCLCLRDIKAENKAQPRSTDEPQSRKNVGKVQDSFAACKHDCGPPVQKKARPHPMILCISFITTLTWTNHVC